MRHPARQGVARRLPPERAGAGDRLRGRLHPAGAPQRRRRAAGAQGGPGERRDHGARLGQAGQRCCSAPTAAPPASSPCRPDRGMAGRLASRTASARRGPMPRMSRASSGWVVEALALGADDLVAVNEIACTDPACPGLETVVLVMASGEKTRAIKIEGRPGHRHPPAGHASMPGQDKDPRKGLFKFEMYQAGQGGPA